MRDKVLILFLVLYAVFAAGLLLLLPLLTPQFETMSFSGEIVSFATATFGAVMGSLITIRLHTMEIRDRREYNAYWDQHVRPRAIWVDRKSVV